MCGIMGYFCFGRARPQKYKIENMFGLLETRGRDASGFSYLKGECLVVHKAAVPSSSIVKSKEWKELVLPDKMIFHTRLKTLGSELNNQNNHPLFNKMGMCIVHNGIVQNHQEIIGTKKRDAEVDSEAILSILSSHGKDDKVKRLFERIEGSFAVAVLDKNNPDRLILIKKDNPLMLYFDEQLDILYFCSEREIMQKALGITSVTKRGFLIGESEYHFYEMENNHALILNKTGVERYQKYYPKKSEYYYGKYYDKSYWVDEDMLECPNCQTPTLYDYTKLFNRCSNCGESIEDDIFIER